VIDHLRLLAKRPAWATPYGLSKGELRSRNVRRLQQRLIELGYMFGAADGNWGLRSKKALEDFRVAHGMLARETWDRATQDRLFSAAAKRAPITSDIGFVGRWATNLRECRQSPSGRGSLVISARRAEAFGGVCEFGPTERETQNMWRLQATCAYNRDRWTANIRFTLDGNTLIWSSERGATKYVRCSAR
jgi:peptidoglycan hydrolase-like protein with peptidoglycan-binding domain